LWLPPPLHPHTHPCLLGLRSLSLAGNSFTQLPASLTSATNLASLHLSGNPDLLLRTADVDATRRSMPGLAHLSLPATAVPAPLAAHLAGALPGVELTLTPP
jgi:hypothetical protein